MVMSVTAIPYHSHQQHALNNSNGPMRRISADATSRSTVTPQQILSRQTTSLRSHIPCKFFRSGCCYRGEQCQFSHDAVQPALPLSAGESNSVSVAAGNDDRFHESPPENITAGSSAQTNSGQKAVVVDDSMPLAWTLAPATSQRPSQNLPPAPPLLEENPKQNQICRFFLRGICAHGDSCRYSHAISDCLRDNAEQTNAQIQAPPQFASARYARQMSLGVVPSDSNLHASELVHSVLGNGSRTSLLDADSDLLTTLPLAGSTTTDRKLTINRFANKKSSPAAQRRTSVAHGEKLSSNKSYAAAVSSLSSTSLQSLARQPKQQQQQSKCHIPQQGEEQYDIFGRVYQQHAPADQQHGIAIRQSTTNNTNNAVGLLSQSVPLLSSSGSFFDMLSSEQDTFNYTRLHMSSGESNSSLILPANNNSSEVATSPLGLHAHSPPSSSALNIGLGRRQLSRRGSCNTGTTMPRHNTNADVNVLLATPRAPPAQVRGEKLDGEVFLTPQSRGGGADDSCANTLKKPENASRTWWSLLGTPTADCDAGLPSIALTDAKFTYDNNVPTFCDDASVSGGDSNFHPLTLYFGALAGTTDEDVDDYNGMGFLDNSVINSSSFAIPFGYGGGGERTADNVNNAAACACYAAAFDSGIDDYTSSSYIPLDGGGGSVSSADNLMMLHDMANSTTIRGEVFYGPTQQHAFMCMQPLTNGDSQATAALFGGNEFPALPDINNQGVGDLINDEWHRAWQQKRLEGRPEMFAHASAMSSGIMRRASVCRAGRAGRCVDLECPYRHGQLCEWCGCEAIDADDPAEHMRECSVSMEANMELSFNVARSEHRECGVCQEEIFENGRRFGILPNCKHVFCLSCIRNWRERKQQGYDKDAVRGCPECRVKSDFVVPSQYFVADEAEKQRVIEHYQQEMKKIHCKYFNRGAGECPFGDSCFYLHVDKRGQPITGLRPMFDSHTLLGCAFIEVEQGLTQRQRRQQRRHQQQQQRGGGSAGQTAATVTSSTAALRVHGDENEAAEEEDVGENSSNGEDEQHSHSSSSGDGSAEADEVAGEPSFAEANDSVVVSVHNNT